MREGCDLTTWLEIINPDEGLHLILGRKRYGKSVLGYYLLEILYEKTGKDCYVYGLPEEKTHLLPEFITPIYNLDLPERSIILFDEAYISFHARGSLSSINKAMDTLSGLVGQKSILALFITQQSRKLDVGVISAADGLFFKMPSMLQAKFERPEIRRLSESVYEKFKDIDGNKKIYTYVMTDDFEGFVTNPKPTFWTEGLSKAFEGVEIGNGDKTHKKEKKKKHVTGEYIVKDLEGNEIIKYLRYDSAYGWALMNTKETGRRYIIQTPDGSQILVPGR